MPRLIPTHWRVKGESLNDLSGNRPYERRLTRKQNTSQTCSSYVHEQCQKKRRSKRWFPISDSIMSSRKGSHFLENWQDKGKTLVKPPYNVKNGTHRAAGMTQESECCLLFLRPGSSPSSQVVAHNICNSVPTNAFFWSRKAKRMHMVNRNKYMQAKHPT